MVIPVKEFRRNMKKYFESVHNGPLEIERLGKVYTLSLGSNLGEKGTLSKKEEMTKENYAFAPRQAAFAPRQAIDVYGCGCKRGDERLCKKHGRL